MEGSHRGAEARLAGDRVLSAAGRARLTVKVVPRASREGLVGWLGEALKVRVAAAPERGRANEAVRDILAEALGVGPERVRLVAGHTVARKVFEIEGLEPDEARLRIEAALTR